MKLLLVLASDETYDHIAFHVMPLGFDFIRYQNVLKAMDNIDEVDPTGIIISARDYPRHWKTMVQFVRNERSKDVCPIILLKGDKFPIEDSSKASFLGVSGIINEQLNDSSEVIRIQEILCRYLPTEEKRRARRHYVQNWQRLNFIFTIPSEKNLVTGVIKTISSRGISFLPDHENLLRKTTLHEVLPECSLRVGEIFLSPLCCLARTGRILSIEFMSFPDGEQEILDDYILNSSFLEWKNRERVLVST